MGKGIKEIIERIPEPRRGNGIRHKLSDVIIKGYCLSYADMTNIRRWNCSEK